MLTKNSLPSLTRCLVLAALSLLIVCGCGSSNTCGESEQDPDCHSLVFDGVTRAYLLHVPANFQPNSSALVIALHSADATGLSFVQISQLNVKADQEGFAVAYPYALVSPGTGYTEWNDFFNNSFGDNPPDDVGFIRQLIMTLQGTISPDPKKIYVTGLSSGGFMAHRIGVQLSDLVAAIAVVEGTVVSPGAITSVPPAQGPVSILMLHGDGDTVVPYCAFPPVASQEQTFNYWAGTSGDNCSALDTVAPLCDVQGNITTVFEKDATSCNGHAEVKFYKLNAGGHAWYNAPMDIPGQLPFNPDFNSNTGGTTDDILWNFFASHPKP